MKREELQIGDIVDVHRCECVADGGHFQEWDEYGKVVSITEYYITIKYIGREEDYGFEDVNGEDIKPIPLTPEILEKNGWSKDLYDNEAYDNDDFEQLSLWEGADRNAWWWHVGVELVIPLNFVHELQHALRLCNISKEIEI